MSTLAQPFIWALAAGVGMFGFGLGILVTALRGPSMHSARNSVIVAFFVGALIVALAIYLAPVPTSPLRL